ncbi:MAG: SMP-30/gluconolactonase/LRE family protein [Acidimicrobiales bacterium]
MEIHRIGDVTLGWGESLVWDDRTERLYFVDCAKSALHWLERGVGELRTMVMPSMPTGIVPTEDRRLVAVLDDGLHVVDVDAGTTALIATFPAEIGGRCNDACADLDGNIITGKLNLGPAEGSAWWWSSTDGWRLLDPNIANTNGPTVGVVDGVMTLIIGDTSAEYFAYDYEPSSGTVGPRRVFGDTSALDGLPDGATLDADGGFWCALVDGGQLARFTSKGLDRTVPLPVKNPTDVTFGGGPDLDRLYVVSIDGPGELDGALLAIDGLGARGRPEPRARISHH